MDENIENIILELKIALKEKYGNNFSKFYLVDFKKPHWEVLISTKDEKNFRKSDYYLVKEGKVFEDNIIY
jgi:hypothetical protein